MLRRESHVLTTCCRPQIHLRSDSFRILPDLHSDKTDSAVHFLRNPLAVLRNFSFAVVMDKLTEEELAEFKDIYNLVDRAGRGFINKAQLGELMDTLGIDATAEEVDLMLSEIDLDGNNEIDFEEFVTVMSRKVNANYTSEQVKGAFKIFEGVNPPGYVRAEALIRALCIYGKEKLTEEQAAELVGQLEVDASGLVNYNDYVNMMMST